MLTRRMPSAARRAGGFTLIEMMVALVLGLVVITAVLAFIFSLIRANSETVLSTRLNQEMRATMALVANDLRRARGLGDPISAVNQGGTVTNPYSAIDTSTAGCVRYSYAEDLAGTTTNFRALRRNGNKVELVRQATSGAALCTTAGTPLNSDGVDIYELTFTPVNARQIDIVMKGRLRNKPAYMSTNTGMAITDKTIRQTISIRSNGT